MLGKRQLKTGSVAAFVALAFTAAACNPDSATTGPSGQNSQDFAAGLRLVSGDQQIGPLAAPLTLPIVVRVVDAGGNPVKGATVTFGIRAGGGSVNPAANISGADGIVSASWTMGNTLGANKAVALLTGAFLLDSAVFNATATVGVANRFAKVSGDSQTKEASRVLGAPLVVKLQDQFGNNISGVKVTWTPAALNGSVSFATDTTAADGTASANWRIGNIAGAQNLTATVAGLSTPIAFFATATPDTGRILTVLTGQTPAQSGTGGAALPTALSIRVTDQYLNVISGAGVTWNDSVAGGGSLSVSAGATSASGTASTTWTLGRRPGTQLVRAKLTGRTETATFTASATVSLTDVQVGNFSACGIASDGTAMCWGYGADGQLGKLGNQLNTNQITTSVTTTDTLLGPFLTFRSTAVGKNHACGVTIGRDVYCWGAGNAGQIGGASAGGVPGKWKGDLPWVSVSAGEFNTCAITPAGAVYCSGLNDQGQLGGGTVSATAVAAPVQVVSAGITDTLFNSIAVGQTHVCGIPRAPGTQVPRCWGMNTSGQIGDGSGPATSRRTVPTVVTNGGARPTGYDSTSLVSGNTHSCAIATVGGTVGGAYCWGGNGFGQVGDGTTTNAAAPALVTGGLTFVQLTAGSQHTCGLTAAGTAYCWGRNASGQIGDGTRTDRTAGPVLVSGGLTFRTISAGELFTCGVQGTPGPSGGTSAVPAAIYCWGDNEYGQLGNVTLSQANNAPTLVPTKISFTNP